jgi:EAL domain-containing protein (putative c-di-GMP-specific phosphodiesterase class I)
MTNTSMSGSIDGAGASSDLVQRVVAGLSDDFFAQLLAGIDLGTLTTDDVRHRVLDEIRATLDDSSDGSSESLQSLVTLHPIVHLESNAIIGYEATIAVRHEGSQSVSDIERGTSRSASMEVDAARLALARLEDVPRGQFLAVKVSSAGLQHDRLFPALLESNVDRVVVEISEGEAADIGAIRHGIDALARIGVRSAIDGAGRGLFRGASLYEVTPALLKIDPSIVDGCADDSEKRVQIEKLIAVGRRLGALVVADGVDTRDALATVFLLGVDAAQGTCVQPADMVVTSSSDWSESSIGLEDLSESLTTESAFSFTNSV